ncbi:PIG-L family deacetylase [Psychroserpens sp.]|uniref:PIG-L family deacetylase n=1 Tax=Psychroserpens sp. TaxID=2020870 RepID=UPI001B19E38D|nr:PIG-L family deacetylase [Psychroserpens sp.]MBO6607538.1 PIG-L family deacetylase [Psychroserpens sp.]MBO6655198.1 PIG-L family deacetylase [Psychroserpens sp.]MBO6683212.1 PIG-L family deacetylase [Psychroserpens sp.]MBO6749776.1 PIG-L family deacetylase [Psychroserpens sp.]MBO6916700.1 PIG-L family deacetylase [Psychroserpens sp.]
MHNTLRLLFFFLVSSFIVQAQQPKKPSSSEIFESIKKLNFLGSVLYVAAHPDDENTRLISYMANEVHARTAYLSLTRGDGGQNLIGPEIRELLGVIRTQELLAARRTDGGEQRFTRANDFGYSKHPDETFAIWNKEEVLSDVVLAIRQFKPDVIINRFNHRNPGTTHGHHTGSAMLSIEAFDLVADANAYPEQLQTTELWQPKRLFFNTSWWFYGSRENFEKADKTNLLEIDTGVYYADLGLSNPEIAALSRSQHKSQGFGSTGSRGTQNEYVELIKGELPKDKSNIFEGVDTTWNRVEGGAAVGEVLNAVQNNYDFKNPAASIPELVRAYSLIQNLEDSHWKRIKTEEIKGIIEACAGLYLEATANTNHTSPGSSINLNLEVINRSDSNIRLVNYVTPNGTAVEKGIKLDNNTGFDFKETALLPDTQAVSTPYWLTKKGSLGMYKVEDKSLIGNPETPRALNVRFNLNIENVPISFTKPIVYKTNDPVKGEVYKPFEIIPEASAKISEKVIIIDSDAQRDIEVIVKSGSDNLEGYVQIAHPNDWSVYPKQQKVAIKNKGQEARLIFTVIPPKGQSEGLFTPMVHIGENVYTRELIEIDYDHIPFQTVLLPSESKIVRLDIQKRGENIGYIEGAGDVVPESLRQIGYNVAIIKPEDITEENLKRFDAIVVGIRAYNTVDELKFKQDILFNYVAEGGNMIVQYNTNRRVKVDQIAPYNLRLSRDRVTDEYAKVDLIAKDHEVLNVPNKITTKDFEGWTQERGLYFPNDWAAEFTPILAMNDKGESSKQGSLLVASYGKGHYIYTGLSFFREFPAGVSGAYRLFANMLSLGKNDITPNNQIKN